MALSLGEMQQLQDFLQEALGEIPSRERSFQTPFSSRPLKIVTTSLGLDPVSRTPATFVNELRRVSEFSHPPKTMALADLVKELSKQSVFFDPSASPMGAGKGIEKQLYRLLNRHDAGEITVKDLFEKEGALGEKALKSRTRLFEAMLGGRKSESLKFGARRIPPVMLLLLLLPLLASSAFSGKEES